MGCEKCVAGAKAEMTVGKEKRREQLKTELQYRNSRVRRALPVWIYNS